MTTTPTITPHTDAAGDPPLHVVVLLGSDREGRFGPTIARWVTSHVADHGALTVDLVDVADEDLPRTYPRRPADVVGRYLDRLDAADALVIVTPEYNHSFPAALKQALDLIGKQLAGKPVGFVSYGGISGGLRAVEALRPVLAELHATTIRDTVSLAGPWGRFDVDGTLVGDAEPAETAMKAFLAQLTWWAEGLRAARTRRPYGS